ncbi:MurR/RpiR family transcriptional regulator [Sporosarcina sp. FSL K6-3457]|uniref:MurR/RpiR family transcriptional regulator n=1 Tax=Sporosarcina sp. FSL K6-3457 TaxID=2978204 RepID=UPI0030FC3B58
MKLGIDMFSYEKIQSFNKLEFMVYDYVMKNGNQVLFMTIRELAEAVYVSTSTILRFCKKVDCDGYAEFRVQFKLYLEQSEQKKPANDIFEILHYFKSTNNVEFEERITKAGKMVQTSKQVIFVGVGSSGILGKYGARYFSNMGKFSHHIDDPFYPIFEDLYEDAIVIALSVSGETQQTVHLINQFKSRHCKIISITNSENSTIAKMSDYNIAYYMTNELVHGEYNVTTQVPVIFVLEAIARRI